MNNQAAQTMPALPRPYWRAGEVKDDFGNPYNETDLFTDDDMRAMYRQGYAAALSQTAGVAHLMTGVPDKDGREICAGDRIVYRNASQYTKEEYWNPEYIVEWKAPAFVLRHVGGGKDDSNASFAFNVAVRDPYWAIKLETIAAAPAAQQTAGVADGYVLMPRDPIAALPILHALSDAAEFERLPDPGNADDAYPITGNQSTVYQWYKAMLAAAPAASGGEVKPEPSPKQCRERLMREGKPYPKSGCAACKTGGLTGCPYEKAVHEPQPPSAASASGGEADTLPDGTLSKSTVKRVTALAGASVSERARELPGDLQWKIEKLNPSSCGVVSLSQEEWAYARMVIEQALTQQRGDGDAVDRDAWAEALELPQGYTVEEFLPGGWHYAWTRADGERMVSGTTWNHPALAAIAAWQYAPATIPQPSADAARDDRCRHENGSPGYDHWRCHDCGAFKTDSGWGVASHRYFNKRSEAEFYKKHGRLPEHASTQPWGNGNTMTTDELESLLARVG